MAESSKEKLQDKANDSAAEKWTEIEHLPEWDEEFYHVFTAKKHGKWLMLKTLKPEHKDNPEMQAMLEKEFEARYNLAHPNIVMINDLDDVPGIGRCIITDDVYGLSLRKLIDQGKLKRSHIHKLAHQGVEALEYIQTNHLAHHPLRAERILFTENIENLKLIDVGFEQRSRLTHADTNDDILNFGLVLTEALAALPESERLSSHEYMKLKRVANRCTDPNPSHRYRSIQSVRMAINDRSSRDIYITIIIFLVAMIAFLIWVLSKGDPLAH